MRCPHCQSQKTIKKGAARLRDHSVRQRHLCRDCGKRFKVELTAPYRLRCHTPIKDLLQDW